MVLTEKEKKENAEMKIFVDKYRDIVYTDDIKYSHEIEQEVIQTLGGDISPMDKLNYKDGIRKFNRVFCPYCYGLTNVLKYRHIVELRQCSNNEEHIFFVIDERRY